MDGFPRVSSVIDEASRRNGRRDYRARGRGGEGKVLSLSRMITISFARFSKRSDV